MPPTGGLGLFSALIMPVSIFLTLRKDRGPIAKFIDAGATTPQTARRPQSLQITAKYAIENPIRRRVLVPTEDGRYWVDVDRYRTWRRRVIIAAVTVPSVLFVVVFGLAWWMMHRG